MKQKTKNDILLDTVKKVHMIGIGGSGMYPIAEILQAEGYEITGSDNNETDTLARVRAMGIPVALGHKAENVEGAELVIYSAAIMKDNPELIAAEKLGIPTLQRSYALGAITRKYNNVIGVCGTHGKTTVTSMITQILVSCGKDPSAVIGGKLPLIDGNGCAGRSDIMVCESCEFADTFLQLSPDLCVLLNIDLDHMEYFKTEENLLNSFKQFAAMAKLTLINGNDARAMRISDMLDGKVLTYGITSLCDFYAANIKPAAKTAGEYDLMGPDGFICHVVVGVPGSHNISNSVAAMMAAIFNGVEPELAAKALSEFRGAGRRFEILGVHNDITIADDYAHHPKELEVTLKTANKMGYKRVIAIFQPFTFSRTAMLLDDFAKALSLADLAVLSPIMGSREVNTLGIASADLGKKIPGSVCCDTFEEIADFIVENARPGDLVITLGCGDIYKVAKQILNKF